MPLPAAKQMRSEISVRLEKQKQRQLQTKNLKANALKGEKAKSNRAIGVTVCAGAPLAIAHMRKAF